MSTYFSAIWSSGSSCPVMLQQDPLPAAQAGYKALGKSSWCRPNWVVGSWVIMHWNFPKSYLCHLSHQTDALNQDVFKKTMNMWKVHFYFCALLWHFIWNSWICFLYFFSSVCCSFKLKVYNSYKNKIAFYFGRWRDVWFANEIRKINWDFPVYLKVFLCQKIHFSFQSISLWRRVLCLTFAVSDLILPNFNMCVYMYIQCSKIEYWYLSHLCARWIDEQITC